VKRIQQQQQQQQETSSCPRLIDQIEKSNTIFSQTSLFLSAPSGNPLISAQKGNLPTYFGKHSNNLQQKKKNPQMYWQE
jgi:hypothetical protein